MAAAILVDGNFAIPYSVSPPRFSQPFEGDAGEYILEQDFWVHENHFAALPLNTPHESPNGDPARSYANYYLVKESPTTKVGNGILSWTRTYAQIPNSRIDPSTIVYKFPGFAGVIYPVTGNTTLAPGRLPGNYTVPCFIQNDYFITLNNFPSQQAKTGVILPPSGGSGSTQFSDSLPQPITSAAQANGSGVTLLNDISGITSVAKQRYYIPPGSWSGGVFTPLYTDPAQAALQGMQVDSIWDSSGPYAGSPACVPTLTLYRTWVDQKLLIVAEDSTVARWMGNIYVRQTKYVTAI